ncbi:hypothetical protein [Acinetobacter puyangensis]|uniref:hypothetical protein n=1 Tax=Acinetobacter puyangensis TaxID=1096779 RepID=UPI003A4E1274
MKKIGLMIGVLLLAGCAQVPLNKQTTSGYAEATFQGVSLEDARNRLVLGCNRTGLNIRETSSNKVVCSKTMEGMSAVFTQAAIGNKYSTTPEELLVFQLAKIDNNVHVSARNYTETQMALGQINRVEIKNNKSINNMQILLDNVANEYASKQTKPLVLQSAPPPMK